MITRIVRMVFRKGEIEQFQTIFNETAPRIRQVAGCSYLSLHRDKSDERVFFTISSWESEEHLQVYRNSDFFQSTWKKVKQLFGEKPEAFTLDMQSEYR